MLFSSNLQFDPHSPPHTIRHKEKSTRGIVQGSFPNVRFQLLEKWTNTKTEHLIFQLWIIKLHEAQCSVTPRSPYWTDYNGFLRQLTLFLKKTIPTFIEKPLWKIVWIDATRILLYHSQPYFHHFHNHKIHHHLHEVCNFLRWLAPCQC